MRTILFLSLLFIMWTSTTCGSVDNETRLARDTPHLRHASRRLLNVGNVAVTYSPYHNAAYPLNGSPLNIQQLREQIEGDFAIMRDYFTIVRTYHTQFYGINIAEIAQKYGIKLWLGVYMTTAKWREVEVDAAVFAIENYGDTVQAVVLGSENLANFRVGSSDIIGYANWIRSKLGWNTRGIKFGTSQRINEFVDPRFDRDMTELVNNLDFLGVNIYPFFTNSYNGDEATALLSDMWEQAARRYPREKLVLTETGFATAGNSPWVAPSVVPSLRNAINYYTEFTKWQPPGGMNNEVPRFWFMMFDRRDDDTMGNAEYEKHFGFFYANKFPKSPGNFPLSGSSGNCNLEPYVDYVGMDIGNARSRNAEGCCSICQSFAGCRAFTWSNYWGGTCWLKSGKGDTVGSDYTTSAVLN